MDLIRRGQKVMRGVGERGDGGRVTEVQAGQHRMVKCQFYQAATWNVHQLLHCKLQEGGSVSTIVTFRGSGPR